MSADDIVLPFAVVGLVVAGVVGARRFFYDVWGDAVNLASRLEGQSKTYDVGTIVGTEIIGTINGSAKTTGARIAADSAEMEGSEGESGQDGGIRLLKAAGDLRFAIQIVDYDPRSIRRPILGQTIEVDHRKRIEITCRSVALGIEADRPLRKQYLEYCQMHSLLRSEHGLVTDDIGAYMFEQLGRVTPVIEIPEAGHHAMLDQPLILLTALRSLLADWDHSDPHHRRPA